MESDNNTQFFLINQNASYDSKKFKYKLEDIELEIFSEQIRDEEMRDTLLKNDMKKYDEEKENILYDLSLLENISEIKQ